MTWRTVAYIDGNAVRDHSMPVIGYRHEYYKGWCWKRVMPDKRWILVDSTWSFMGNRSESIGVETAYNNVIKQPFLVNKKTNSRGLIRFDARSNYFTVGAVTYVRSY